MTGSSSRFLARPFGRAFLSWCVSALALLTGLLTAAGAAENRSRGDDLDRLERWCEAQSRRNELQCLANQRQEWRLLCPESAPDPRGRKELAP